MKDSMEDSKHVDTTTSSFNKMVGFQSFRTLVREPEKALNNDKNQKSSTVRNNAVAKAFYSLQKRFKKVDKKISQGNGLATFFLLLGKYISKRFRVVILLTTVLFELVSDGFISLKDNFVRKLFWGRSKAFRVVTQFMTLSFVLFVFLFGGYRNRIVEIVQMGTANAYANERSNSAQSNYYSDVLIQNATTITDVPQERGRYGIVEYEVKAGDSFFKIGQFFGISEKTIRETNNLSAAYTLKPGNILKIPPADGIIIKVAKGENLEAVAKKYKGAGQTIEEVMQSIADVNWLDAPFELKEGEELFIPGGELPKPPVIKKSSYAGISSSKNNISYSQGGDDSVGRFLGWPVAGGRGNVTQCFKTYHNGVDIADGSMPDLVAAADGTVVFAGCHSGRCPAPGQMTGGSGAAWGVEIDHGNGYTTVYVHMFQIYVKAGDKVTKGQAIGQMGKTGTATGIHVHFMLWKGGRWKSVNPAAFLERRICGS